MLMSGIDKFFKSDIRKNEKREMKRLMQKLNSHPAFCDDGVLYVWDKKEGKYIEEHDVLDDIVEMFEEKDKKNQNN